MQTKTFVIVALLCFIEKYNCETTTPEGLIDTIEEIIIEPIEPVIGPIEEVIGTTEETEEIVDTKEPIDTKDEVIGTTEQAIDPIREEADATEEIVDATEEPTDTKNEVIDTTEPAIDPIGEVVDTTEKIIDGTEEPTDTKNEVIDTTEPAIDPIGEVVDTTEKIIDTTEPAIDPIEEEVDTTEKIIDATEEPTRTKDEVIGTAEQAIGNTEEAAVTSEGVVAITEDVIAKLRTKIIDAKIAIKRVIIEGGKLIGQTHGAISRLIGQAAKNVQSQLDQLDNIVDEAEAEAIEKSVNVSTCIIDLHNGLSSLQLHNWWTCSSKDELNLLGVKLGKLGKIKKGLSKSISNCSLEPDLESCVQNDIDDALRQTAIIQDEIRQVCNDAKKNASVCIEALLWQMDKGIDEVAHDLKSCLQSIL